MSLSRLALRLAVVEALAPPSEFGKDAPAWPTMVPGDRIFDSQIGTEPTTEAARRAPMISVYTDDSKVDPSGAGFVFVDDGIERCTLAFEIIVPGVVTLEDGYEVLVPVETDALAEAMVDAVGAQVASLLQAARMTGPLRHVLIDVEKVESRPWRDADSDVRLSARRDEYEVTLRRSGDIVPGQSGLDRLPDPLRAVALDLATGGYARVLAETIAAALVDPAILPRLLELRFAGSLVRAAGETPPVVNAASTPPTGDVAGRVIYPEVTP